MIYKEARRRNISAKCDPKWGKVHVGELLDGAYDAGYIQALDDYGIWKDGEQRIGCMGRPVKEIIKEILDDA